MTGPAASTELEPSDPSPLAGYTVAVTAARRKEELGALLDRRGARVIYAPAIHIVPLADDAELVAATRAVLERPIDLVVATTGVGFRGWLEAADAWDLPLVAHLHGARVLARGPKARGAIRGGGLVDAWSPESESSAEVLAHLLSGAEGSLEGRRIAVQLHGDPLRDVVSGLQEAGAEVLTVPVYRWVLPEDVAPVRRLVETAVAGGVDAITFTSAPAAKAFLQLAGDARPCVLDRFHDRTLVACVGPVTAAPLTELGVPVLMPERYRLGALIRTVTDELPRRAVRLQVAGSCLEVRGHAVLIDGVVHTLAPAAMAILSSLVARPGVVVSKEQLVASLPRGNDGHAVDVAVARLRSALGSGRHIETVIKRGYRLRVDEPAA
jgi:uroporphyrinogen-III synthase